MLPVNCGSHADYQNFVVTNLRKYYPNPNTLARSTWDIIERFWNLDLSFTDTFMADKYSKFGPAPRTPSCMQRSYLLSIDFKVTSLTEWVAQLKMNPLYAILSGFEVGNTPGVGTFYDFLNRLWDSDDGCISCTCESPCSNAKYGRTVHLVLKDNPRLFNNPPRSSKEWKLEYNARISAERSNKREKLDFKLEDGRHRSTKMWYCRLYHILMLQHLDAWDLPPESPLKKLILDVA